MSSCCLGCGVYSKCSINCGWVVTTKSKNKAFWKYFKGKTQYLEMYLKRWLMPNMMDFLFLQNAKEEHWKWNAHCPSTGTIPPQSLYNFFLPCPVINASVPQCSLTLPARVTISVRATSKSTSPSSLPPPELQIPEVTKQMLPAFSLQFFLSRRDNLMELRRLQCWVLTAHFSLCYIYPRSQSTRGHLEGSSGFSSGAGSNWVHLELWLVLSLRQ